MTLRTFLQSPRLRLREFGPHDVGAIVDLHRESRVRALLVDDHPLDDPLHAWSFIRALGRIYRSHEGHGIWHCEWLQEGRWHFCGWFNLLPLEGECGAAEIGCRLMPMAWGTGLPLEGGRLLVDHAFGALGLARILGFCHPSNRSVKLALLALGFQAQGTRDYAGRPASHYTLSPRQWACARTQARRQRLRQALAALRATDAAVR